MRVIVYVYLRVHFWGIRFGTRKHACLFGGHTKTPRTLTRTHTAAFILMIIYSYECMFISNCMHFNKSRCIVRVYGVSVEDENTHANAYV